MSSNLLHQIVLISFFVLAVIGSAALGYARLRKRQLRRPVRVAFITAIIFGLFGIGSSCMGIIWDGGFPQEEFEISFRDASGNATKGVELRVEDNEGRPFYFYPVSDYAPDLTPTSDENGIMIFHHIRSTALEFGGHEWYLFFFIPIGDGSPKYVCRFLHDGREVYRIPYHKLRRRNGARETEEVVKRHWKTPQSLVSLFETNSEESGEQRRARIQSFFHVDPNGNSSREAGISYYWAREEVYPDDGPTHPLRMGREGDQEFSVIRRTIVVR
jgi:hypothetical protein